jgi:hypothetical protein
LDVDISASGVRIGTDLFVGFPSERVQLRLRKVFVFNMKLHSKTKPATVAWANADIRSNASVGGVLLVLLGDVIESTPEAGGVSGRKSLSLPEPSSTARPMTTAAASMASAINNRTDGSGIRRRSGWVKLMGINASRN